MLYTTRDTSPVGDVFLAAKEDALVGLWIYGQKYFLGASKEPMEERDECPVLQQAKGWLDRYFAGEKPSASELKLAPQGSEFQKIVWKLLLEIPYGELTTYGTIAKEAAKRMGKSRMSAQAVGGAVGHNPVSIIIPCHRVVGTNGSLTGYAGGIDKKQMLLTHEGADRSSLIHKADGSWL